MILYTNAIIVDKNIEIVRLDVMIEFESPTPPFCVCEFMITLSFRLSKRKTLKIEMIQIILKLDHFFS